MTQPFAPPTPPLTPIDRLHEARRIIVKLLHEFRYCHDTDAVADLSQLLGIHDQATAQLEQETR